MSTSSAATLLQSKHWIKVPSTSPMVLSARLSPGHRRRPIPNGSIIIPSWPWPSPLTSNLSGLNSSGSSHTDGSRWMA